MTQTSTQPTKSVTLKFEARPQAAANQPPTYDVTKVPDGIHYGTLQRRKRTWHLSYAALQVTATTKHEIKKKLKEMGYNTQGLD